MLLQSDCYSFFFYVPDPSNKPGWYLPEHNSHFTYKLPLYSAVVTVDSTKQESKVSSLLLSLHCEWAHNNVHFVLFIASLPEWWLIGVFCLFVFIIGI